MSTDAGSADRTSGSPTSTARAVLSQDGRARRAITSSLSFHVGAFVAGAALLLLLARTVDRVFADRRRAGDVVAMLAAIVLLAVVRAGFLWCAEIIGQRGSNHLRRNLRQELLSGLFRTDDARGVRPGAAGATVSVGSAVEDLDGYVTGYLPAFTLAALGPVLVLGVVVVLDPWSTLVLVFAGPMLVMLLALIGRRTRELTARRLEELGWLSALYLDLISGLATLKAHNRSSDAADRVEQVSRAHGDTTMEVLRTAFQTSLVLEWGAAAATALVAVEVGFRLVADHIAFGAALAVLVLVPEFFAPLRRLAAQYHSGHAGQAAWARLQQLREDLGVDARSDDASRNVDGRGRGAQAPVAPPGRTDLVLRDVVVTHQGSPRPALDRFDLQIADGETVALVGHSGAGKSTVLSVILGFHRPTSGAVTIGGVDLGSIDPAEWHRSVAWLPQRPTLLAGTIADNICLGRPDASEDEVREAARIAGAADFVESLADGYDTLLGEDGLRLSGGQRQRIAIARVVLRDAPLVLLDEFTAHLDPDTEDAVAEAVGALLADRTAVVVAHRPRSTRIADRIVVVEQGHVVDEGGHDELMERCAAYRRLNASDGGPDSTSCSDPGEATSAAADRAGAAP